MPARLQLIARTGSRSSRTTCPGSSAARGSANDDAGRSAAAASTGNAVLFVEDQGRSLQLYALKVFVEARPARTPSSPSWPNETPVVDAVGVVSERGGYLDAVLMTRAPRLPPFAVSPGPPRPAPPPARRGGATAWSASTPAPSASPLRHALRRDAGALAAYPVTPTWCCTWASDGQRTHDLVIAEERGRAASSCREAESRWKAKFGLRRRPPEPLRATIVGVSRRATSSPTTRVTRSTSWPHWSERRLGFDVEELELVAGEDAYRARPNPRVVEPGPPGDGCTRSPDSNAQENQARRLLNEIARFGAQLDRRGGQLVPETVAVHRGFLEGLRNRRSRRSHLRLPGSAAEVFDEASARTACSAGTHQDAGDCCRSTMETPPCPGHVLGTSGLCSSPAPWWRTTRN